MVGLAKVGGRSYGCTCTYTAQRPNLANTLFFIDQMQNTDTLTCVQRVMQRDNILFYNGIYELTLKNLNVQEFNFFLLR